MFTDKVRIFVKAGDGGAGCMSFRREAHVPKGGPDGGDGGKGGDIIVQADLRVSSLIDYRFKHHFKATRGTHGKGSKMNGANGEDLVLKVPVGTIVREYNEQTKEVGALIADLTHDGERIIVARGGVGGRGNTHFVTPTRRAPAFAELGVPAEECWVELEMKLMADAALVGVPSAGKSSLISRMSAAKPKIADYPFTTLVPNLGVVKTQEYNYVVADVPGLIEGAHAGKGLGHEFLRHIERSALILHVVDLSGGYEGRDPVEDYRIIKRELELYAPELAQRPCIVVGNKIDAPGAEDAAARLAEVVHADALAWVGGNEFELDQSPLNPRLFLTSAVTGQGLDALMAATGQRVAALRDQARKAAEGQEHFDQIWQHRRDERDKQYQVTKESEGVFRVTGKQIERMVIQTDWENEEAIAFLQHRFKRLKLDEALEAAGAYDGDEVRILGRAFEFESAHMNEADIYGGSICNMSQRTNKIIVIKIGSSTLVTAEGKLDRAYIARLAQQIHQVRQAGWSPVIVSSAAIACGLEALGIATRPSDIPTLQAAASVGQNALMATYADEFSRYDILTSIVLITRHTTARRDAYLHARDTLERLIELGVVPIINENDTVSVEQIRFGDNDTLAALVACLVGARLCVIFSDIEGLYTANPSLDPHAQLIPEVTRITPEVMALAGGATSKVGSGGMITKIRAARVLMVAGIKMIICHGRREHSLQRLIEGEALGTCFVAHDVPHDITPKKLWIALGDNAKGVLVVDDGAKRALISQGSSLLAVGVSEVKGSFALGDIVDICDTDGYLIARGKAGAPSSEISLACGRSQQEIKGNELLVNLGQRPVVHRDELVVFE